MARTARSKQRNECRRCATFCDRVIDPATCVAAQCPALYAYDDGLTGRRYMGCTHKVFGVEIDVELFRAAERTRVGFGAVKMTGTPLACCSFEVEQAYDSGEGDAFRCTNRRFFDFPEDASGAVRAFDLRDLL